jgi:hypothetical protein
MRNFVGYGFCLFALAVTAKADTQLLTNGGFEAGGGSLNGWTVTSSGGSLGTWLADSSPFTPLTGNPTVGPAHGNSYAVTDQFGPGVNALSQAFTVPLGATHVLWSFNMFVNDWGVDFTPGTQYVQALLLANGANPLTGVPILSQLPGPPVLVTAGVPNPYLAYNFDIIGLVTPGQTYQIDFLERDAAFPMNVGVDDVSIVATPEPASVALLLSVLAAVGVCGRRRRA